MVYVLGFYKENGKEIGNYYDGLYRDYYKDPKNGTPQNDPTTTLGKLRIINGLQFLDPLKGLGNNQEAHHRLTTRCRNRHAREQCLPWKTPWWFQRGWRS